MRERILPGATALSDEMKRILHLLQSAWIEADQSESDPEEHKAFRPPILMVEGLLTRTDITHDDIRLVLPVCPIYPNWGKYTLVEMADALRDKKRILFFERGDGGMRWEIEG